MCIKKPSRIRWGFCYVYSSEEITSCSFLKVISVLSFLTTSIKAIMIMIQVILSTNEQTAQILPVMLAIIIVRGTKRV